MLIPSNVSVKQVMDSQDNASQVTEAVYKTKIVHFLGRSVPIILQNENGPCPLLAICESLLCP